MTKTQEYLLKVKERLELENDNQIAKALGINRARISEYMKGKEQADTCNATKMALALGVEPICVIAEIMAESDRTEEKKEFWKGFVSRVGRQAAGIAALAMLGSFSASYTHDAGAATGSSEITKSHIMRIVLTWFRRLGGFVLRVADACRVRSGSKCSMNKGWREAVV